MCLFVYVSRRKWSVIADRCLCLAPWLAEGRELIAEEDLSLKSPSFRKA